MARHSLRRNIRNTWRRLRRLFRREDFEPEDPYAYVTAPRKPRPPYRRAAAQEPEP